MDCRDVEALLSDHVEERLHPIGRAELEAHLDLCPACRGLRDALAEVMEELRSFPLAEPPEGLAERAASAAVAAWPYRGAVIRPAVVVPHWVRTAAAGLALIMLGTALVIVGPDASSRAASRLVARTRSASERLSSRPERLWEDVRAFGADVGVAAASRLDRFGDRVEDYRRLLGKREPDPHPSS